MGDTMSLMLTFFVLLLTFSTLDENRLMDVLGIMSGAKGVMKADGVDSRVEPGEADFLSGRTSAGLDDSGKTAEGDVSPVMLSSFEIKGRFRRFQHRLNALGMKYMLSYDVLEEGVRFQIPLDSLFSSDGGLLASAGTVLQGIANLAENAANEIRLISCLSLDDVSGSSDDGRQWRKGIRQAEAVADTLEANYAMADSRFGLGVKAVSPGREGHFEVIMMEDLGTREASLEDFWKEASEVRKEVGQDGW